MKRFSFFIVMLCSVYSLKAQQSFPDSFIGNWNGKLEIMSVDSVSRNINMFLDVETTSNDSIYKWKMTYELNDSLIDIREYELVVIDKKMGLYQIDEKNGIIIDAYYLNGTLCSFFSVMSTHLMFNYSLVNENLQIDVLMIDQSQKSITGGQSDDVPKVESYRVKMRQKAILKRTL